MAEARGYTERDAERFVSEQHSGNRTAFARDRARVLHSSAWRRLAAKTQVLSPTTSIDFARNRLTHSLEVAQIGRELALALGLDQDVVDTACLAHDLGHPPFGHNGEKALNTWAEGFGGFEGNAQTLRILTRIEPKIIDGLGHSAGLNLTRATLDASTKYPWPREDAPEGSNKFGFFESDREVFEWMREGARPGHKCAEAQVMDLSDDIAYSVHDFEDAVVGEYIDPEILTSRAGHEKLIAAVASWAGGRYSEAALADAFERIARTETWPTAWQGSRTDQAKLKNFTSDMIGRFARAAILATTQAAGERSLARYGADVVVPEEVRAEIAVLKGIVASFVMESGRRQPMYQKQRELITELADALWGTGAAELEPAYAADYHAASNETAARRAIIDQIASLTDQSAITWHRRLCEVPIA